MKALLFLTIAAAVGQAQTVQNPITPYRTGTRVVEITIAATAAGQKPVTDLHASDLRLLDNGTPQTIASFERVAQREGQSTQPASSAAKPPAGSQQQRLSIIVLDALNSSWSDQLYGGEGVVKALSKLPSGDRVAIFALDGNLHLLHDVSTDHESLRAAVERYEAEPVAEWVANWAFFPKYSPADQPSPYIPVRTSPADPDPTLGFDSSPEPHDRWRTYISGQWNAYDFAKTNRVLYTLEALTQVAELTHEYAGPKSVIWVTGGFPTQFESFNGDAPAPDFFHFQAAKAMRQFGIDNAALYPVSPEGLSWRNVEDMKELAEQTGGRVFYASNDVAALVRAAMDDAREGYVLTFVPNDRRENGSVHDVDLKTTRPGVNLRYRNVYVADSANYAIRPILPVTLSTAIPQPAPTVSRVENAGGGGSVIAPNSWVRIKGANLAPAGVERTWHGADFENGKMPAQLDGVAVTMNGKSAYVYYISPEQINVLTPPDLAPGPVQVKVTTAGAASAAFNAQAQPASPSFFTVGRGRYVMGTHSDGSSLGPASSTSRTTPAAPGELIVLFANGFGPVSSPVAAGSKVQSGALPTLPEVKIGGVPAEVHLAGLSSPGVYQLNVVVPASAPSGDDSITATYHGLTTQPGVQIPVQ